MKLQIEIIEEAIKLIKKYSKDKSVVKEQCRIMQRAIQEIRESNV